MKTREWWAQCKPCQEPLPDRAKGEGRAQAREVFHVGAVAEVLTALDARTSSGHLSAMTDHREIELARDCDAIQIPSGHPIVLPTGTKVIITQSLGGTYTVATSGGLARIEHKDADALGLDPAAPATPSVKPEGSLEDAVWAQLKTVFDPEIPVNVVDLGLIYDCRLTDREGGGKSVLVRMTLTAPGCGMGPAIAADARSRLLALEGIDDAEVELVWDPPWNQSMISEEGRMKLGLV